MIEVRIPATERICAVARGDILLKLQKVVEANSVFEESRLNPHPFRRLKVGGLANEARGRGFSEDLIGGGNGRFGARAKAGEPAIEFSDNGDSRWAEYAVERHDCTDPGNIFREPIGCMNRWQRIRAEAVVIDAGKGDALRIEAEEGRDLIRRTAWQPICLHVGAGAPRTVQGGLCVDVVVRSPLVGEVFVFDKGEPKAKAILWSKAADADVHGLSHDKCLAAIGETAEVQLGAAG